MADGSTASILVANPDEAAAAKPAFCQSRPAIPTAAASSGSSRTSGRAYSRRAIR